MVIGTTGFFDGVHRGHLSVINSVCSLAKECRGRSVVVTFWPHPRAVLQQDAAKFRLLTTLDEKRTLIKSYGIDEVVVLPFNKDFASQTTEEFFEKYLVEMLGVETLVVGYDHHVGNDIDQTQEEMFRIARMCGITPIRVEECTTDEIDSKISSTRIRDFIERGRIEEANILLGYRYGLEGAVVEGRRIGRTMGFPTANIRLYEPLKLLPDDGVYIVWVEYAGKTYRGITNIGTRPTIGNGNERTIETHLLDFNEDIYGLSIKIEFVTRLRSERRFESIEQLKEQIGRDKESCYKVIPDINVNLR
ncbi:MAG: bifunctional riboflavin kinase/FAD synthetase [Bacteroidales bacterium]|nr:bifunctional riboflavin kinase/FAD synthetase [Bacteroidales bacterium]